MAEDHNESAAHSFKWLLIISIFVAAINTQGCMPIPTEDGENDPFPSDTPEAAQSCAVLRLANTGTRDLLSEGVGLPVLSVDKLMAYRHGADGRAIAP